MSKKKETGRTYTELKKSMTTEEFEKYCKNIAERYAKSELKFSSTYFTKKEKIKEKCFRLILRDAVVKNLVTDEIVDRMERKSILNQKRHSDRAEMQSHVHYVKLRQERRSYIIATYSKEHIKSIAKYYAEHPELDLEKTAKIFEINKMLLREILEKAIVDNIATDDICNKMIEKSLKIGRVDERKKLFEEMMEKRKSHIESQK